MATEIKYSKKYCHLQSCVNNKGASKETLLFRLPKEEPIRQQWLSAIRFNQNTIDENVNKNFSICENHFEESEINRAVKSRRNLAPNAVPSIFQSTQSDAVAMNVVTAENVESNTPSAAINK